MNVIMISPFPSLDINSPESGVAQYTRNLMDDISNDFSVNVLSQKSTTISFHRKNIKIINTWGKSLLSCNLITRQLRPKDISVIHLQHEFRILGSSFSTQLLLLKLQLIRKKVAPIAVTIHGVPSKKDVNKQFISRNHLKSPVFVMRYFVKLTMWSIKSMSEAVIVHSEIFKDSLIEDYGYSRNRIHVIPIGTSNDVKLNQGTSVSSSGKNVLFFGFLTGYKLPELIIEASKLLEDDQIKFNFCVSYNSRIKNKQYNKRYELLMNSVKNMGVRASWSSYIPDNQVPNLLSSNDVIILPYTDFIAGSGIASLAESYGLKICFSEALRPLFGDNQYEFSLTPSSLASSIMKALTQENFVNSSLVESMTSRESSAATEALWCSLAATRVFS